MPIKYYDQAGNEQVINEDQVSLVPKDWTKAPGLPTAPQYTDMTAQYNQLNQAKYNSTISALDKSKNNALSNISAQEQQIKPKYDTAGLDIRAEKGRSTRSFSDYLKQNGIMSSGVSALGEGIFTGRQQGSLAQNKTSEANEFADIARNRTSVLNNYESDFAMARSNMEAQSMQDKINQENINYDRTLQADNTAYNRDLNSQNTEYNRLQDTKNEYANNVGQYYENYQAEINKVQGDGDPSNDWKIAELTKARQQKIQELAQIDQAQQVAEAKSQADRIKAEATKAQQDFENLLKIQEQNRKQSETNYNNKKPYYAPKSSGSSGGSNWWEQ